MDLFLVIIVLCGVPILLILLAGYFFGRQGVAISSILLFILIAYAWFDYGNSPEPGAGFVLVLFLPLVGLGTILGSIVGFIRN